MSTPARTASSYKSGQTGRRTAFFSGNGVRVALAAACSALLIAGCSQGVGGGLNSKLPPAGGGGLLSFTSVAMPDGIAGRAYSKVAVTTVEAQSKTSFPISPTVASGTAPLASCTVSAGTLPPGMNAALTVDSTGAGCVISGTLSAAAAGNTYQFTIQALDSNSPPRAAAQTFTMKVRPEFTVTAPAAIVANALPAGVQGRTYGQIAGNAAAMTATTNLSATTGNGAVGAKNYCSLSVTPALASLTLAQVAGTNNCQLQGSGALAAAGSYKVTVAITDNPIVDPETNLAAVPANTIAAASNATLNVAAPLKIVAADAVSATPPAAVAGRAYGTGSGCSGGACSPLTYAATGGLPSVEPADSYLFSSSAALAAAGINCAATASSSVAKTTCSGTAAGTGANFSVTVDDPGNFATPSGSASSTTASTSSLSLTVDSALTLAVSPDPAANPAVQNRPYGTGTGCTGAGGACVAPMYTPSGGLGTYSFPAITGTPPVGINCAPNGGNTAVVCSGTPTATGASTFGVAASDVGNASTPSATTAVVSKTLTVNGALTLTPPASLPPAVSGRAFGNGAGCSGGNCVPATFTISGGLGTYSATATVVSSPGTWACPLVGSNYNCSSAAVVSGTPNLSITASDGASATTPGATTASASVAITVNPALAITPPATVADAVTGRPYGTGSGCTGGSCIALQYIVTGGLGTYGAGALTAGPNTFACAGTGTFSCSIGSMSGSGSQTLSLAVADVGNASTPSGSIVDASKSLNILSRVTLTNANLGTTWPDAVQNRSYAGTGFTSDQFTAANGIGPYTFLAPSGFPTGFTCTPAATTDTCSAASVGTVGSYTPQITVRDTGNASTPASTLATDPASQLTASLTVKSPISVTPPNLAALPAVTGRPFGTGSGCSSGNCQPAVFQVNGGLSAYAATASVVSAPGTWSCTLSGTNYNCSSASVGSASNLTIDVSDIANSTTPAATTTSDPGSQASASVTVNGPLTVTPPLTVNDAVTGRPYGTGSGCTGGACVGVTYTAAGGTGTYGSATLTAGSDNFSCSSGPTYICGEATVSVAGTQTLSMTVVDVANASTPSGSVIDTSKSITMQPRVALANANLGTTWPDAVQGRSYAGSGFTIDQFTATNGIGSYTFLAPSGFPAGFTCTPAATTDTCSAASVGAAASYSPQITVHDTGNLSTPASTVATDPASQFTASLRVNAPIALVAPGSLPAAVNLRAFGTGAGCTGGACVPAQFTVSGGLGGYSASATVVTAPGSWSCALTPTGPLSGTYNCSSASVGTAGPNLSITASDTPNSTTPNQVTASASVAVTVNSSLQLVSPSSFVDGVTNRPYGSGAGCLPGPACAAPTYTASGGISPYIFSPSGFPAGLNCVQSSGTYSCTASPITGSANSYSPQVNLTDTGNVSTPASSPLVSTSATLIVQPQLTLAVNPDPAANPAVQGRDYGVTSDSGCSSGSCLAPTYTPSGGLGNYTITAPSSGALPTGITCTVTNQGTSSATASCGGTAIAGSTSSFSVAAVDSANASTPAATSGTDPQSALSKTLTVNPALAISAITLPNGLVGYAYPTVGGASTLTATGGLGSAYTWVPPGGGGCSSTPTGSLPGGLAIAASTGVISGTPNAASTSATDFQFQVCVFDTNNATTPTGFALPNTTGNDLTLNVMAPLAYVTETDNIQVINTQTQTSVTSISSTGNGPFGVAFSPSGRYAYVTLSGVDKLAVYDTIGNTQVGSLLTLTSGCIPEGVGATATNVFIACNGLDEVDVVNVSGTTFTVGTPIPIGVSGTGPVGVAVSPDGTRAYVTLSAINKMFVINSSTATPAALGGTNPVSLTTSQGTIPEGIAVALAGGIGPGTVAYIAKQGTSSSVPDGVEVLTLTGDVFNDVASANITTSSNSSAIPSFVAVTPDSARVYVTLNGKDKFAVIDNTASTPAQLSGSPFSLLESGPAPQGIAIPPQSPFQAFIAENGTPDKLAVITDSATTPAETASPISLGAPAPLSVAAIQPPK